jgi:outer membrane protein
MTKNMQRNQKKNKKENPTINWKYLITGLVSVSLAGLSVRAQNIETLNLQKAIDLALQNNHLLNIKGLQVDEKKAKVWESRIKAFPTIITSSAYQYNPNLSQLTFTQGAFGSLPIGQVLTIQLPPEDLSFPLNKHDNFNAGVTLYQPVTQLGKIIAGVDVSRTDVRIAEQEKVKASLQLQQAVEKLYYGLLINQKQKEEAEARLELARMKLHDVESALLSGKTIESNEAGLQAGVADEEQNLLKLIIQTEDYSADLRDVTGLTADSFLLEEVDFRMEVIPLPDSYRSTAMTGNPDLLLAGLSQTKAEQARKAARYSYLPELGLIAGYTYQTGNIIYPEHNPFIGASFKWNLQDILLNRQLVNQRNSSLQQAREFALDAENKINSDIDKACRKIKHAEALVTVTQKAVYYRQEELKIQQDKQACGLNTAADLLNARALLAKAQADLLAAQMNYRIAFTDLQVLRGE